MFYTTKRKEGNLEIRIGKGKNRMKRFLCMFLAAVLVCSLGITALAAVEDTGFEDVASDSWYAGAVEYVRDEGVMIGTDEGVFSPELSLSRAMLATALYQAAGSPAVEGDDGFTDTAEGEWYSDAVTWAAQNQVVGGYGNGLFGTNDPITREDMAQMLWNYAGRPVAEVTQPYSDQAQISGYAVTAVAWARERGYMSGQGNNRFNPQADLTRAEAAQALYNSRGLISSEPAEDHNVLVVYFSATGNTERAAQYIADATGGDLFELEPVNPYTNEDLNWTADGSRVNQEHEDESLRDVELVADTVDNWDQYDTVFIGYPIWWGIAAWPVDGFVEANDFSGKTVISFCTSSSSGLGESGQLLADMAGTGDWMGGQRFSSSVNEAAVQEWIDSLGLS